MRSWGKRLKDAMSIGVAAAMVASLCCAAPSAASATDDGAAGSTAAQDSATQTDYTNQYFADLLSAGKLSAGAGVEMKAADNAAGILVSGPADELSSTGIAVDKTFNFNAGAVSRVRVQALTARKTKATLACYIDGQTTPVASFVLAAQKKAGNWDVGTKDYCLDISSFKLTGEHTVSFKILDASAEIPQVLLKTFEFMEFSVPVLDFHIDESLGTVAAMNNSADHSVECYGSFDVNVPEGYVGEYTGKQLESGSYDLDYIRGRGNSTWDTDIAHKPYKLKLDKKAGLLGMGKNKHWVLIANYYDNSQLRNKITYWLSEQLGFEYTVKLEPVEVVMNGEYYGSYYLCEQVRVGKNRLDIDDLEETPDATDAETISGGYLLNMDYSIDQHQGFTTNHGVTTSEWTIESPKFDTYFNETQYKYIKDYVDNVEGALYSDDFKDSKGRRYTDYLDLQSAVDYLWLQEYSMNGDAYMGGSNYMYKKRNGKLYYGPMWDFDYVAWGSTEYDGLTTTGWQQFNQSWVERLVCDKEFTDLFIKRWSDLKDMLEELTKAGGKLDQFAARISKMVNYNVEKYGMTDLWHDDDFDEDDADVQDASADDATTPLTFEQEVERLRAWIEQRESWVDSHVNQLTPIKCKITYKNGKKTVGAQNVYVGQPLYSVLGAPKKKGYTFAGWKYKYHVSYERYLKMNNLTEAELVEQEGAQEAARIKKNGMTVSGVLDEEESEFTVPGDVTFTAVFISNAVLGKVVTRKGVRYQVTGIGTKSGRSVKVLGLAKAKAKRVVIAKRVKINGRKYLVTELGAKALAGCKKLKRVTIKVKGLYVRNATFKALPKKAVVKVPRASVKHYRSIIKCRKVRAI